uniref:(S)-ureidoglycine aminohydrolase cupin domain-containing protein n=1 Tax=Corethron hystrix TaxID=216773 RepID=A0A7S1BDB3_9STRA|mmetsp:Transcript_21261/g.48300  ORF Transcript_21261/g.48300 Transcript_21261/m.48300 type:complete len:352 (+) Transcript_21261:161-1216(+)
MEGLITHTPASAVTPDFVAQASDWPLWDSADHPQDPPGSGKFAFNYNGDYASERVLIVSGRATLAPDDGGRRVVLNAGDAVVFHHGFACEWTVQARMTKRYQYFDAEGSIRAPAAIACDGCGCDCEAESYLVGEEDFCPDCYAKDGRAGEHQKFGEPVPVPRPKANTKKRVSKKAPAKKSAVKKKKADATPPPTEELHKTRPTDKKTARRIITTVPNFGGRRCAAEGPASVQSWGMWDCDPDAEGERAPSQHHGYGRTFPWHFDVLEKAYVVEGSATLTADDPVLHGAPVTIRPRDMVTFPKGWRGSWEVHSFLRKRYAFFDHRGIQIDEEEEEDDMEPAVTKRSAKRAKH